MNLPKPRGMKRVSPKKWVFFVATCFVFLQTSSMCYGQEVTEEIKLHDDMDVTDVPTESPDRESEEIHVEDYLESLSLSELDEICQHRGFAVEGSTREDYINAARRCLSLENEMNAILAQNPELAAELEKEIERMKAEKERLEAERQDLLEQISGLQQQLAETGVHDTGLEEILNKNKNPADMTAKEVFKESIGMLYERVAQDVRFVSKILSPVLSPIVHSILGASRLFWRYAKAIFVEVVPEETRISLEQHVAKFLPMRDWIREGGAIHTILRRARHSIETYFEN